VGGTPGLSGDGSMNPSVAELSAEFPPFG